MASRQADVIVIGAGVFGLHTALALQKRGKIVRVLDRANRLGAGASGGIVGALAPHMPERWNAKKQFQLDALLSLAPLMAEVERVSGLSTGFGKSGRITPLETETARERAMHRAAQAADHWPRTVEMRVLPGDAWPRWMTPEAAPHGLVHDTLSARLYPARTITALAGAFAEGPGTLSLGANVRAVRQDAVELADGTRISARQIVIAAGVPGFELMAQHVSETPGRGEKGQAILLDFDAQNLPVIQGDGLYVVPHAGGGVAVGSTSERIYDNPTSTDDQLQRLHRKALLICPRLAKACVVERWAGERPRANGRDPMIGALPGRPSLFAMMGGFKIGFGIAHRCAEAVAQMMCAEPLTIDVPDTFRVEAHLGFE